MSDQFNHFLDVLDFEFQNVFSLLFFKMQLKKGEDIGRQNGNTMDVGSH